MKLKSKNKWAMLVGVSFFPWAALQLNAANIGVDADGSRTVSNNQSGNYIYTAGGNLGELGYGSNPLIVVNAGGTLGPQFETSAIILDTNLYSSDVYTSGLFGAATGNSAPTVNATVAQPVTGIINNGSIEGGAHGIDANTCEILLLNTGTIQGDDAGTNAGVFEPGQYSFIINTKDGTITGRTSSAILGNQDGADDVTIHNAGTIESLTDTAIVLDDDALVINSGEIKGDEAALSVGANARVYNLKDGLLEGLSGVVSSTINGPNNVMKLYNWGTITGTDGIAIDGSGGDDEFYINAGSLINGDIKGNAGIDLVEVVADETGDTEIDGDIYGGDGADEINITASAFDDVLTEFVNGVVTVTGSVFGDAGDDEINLTSSDEGEIIINGGIDSGDDIDVVTIDSLSASSIKIDGGISLGGGSDTCSITAQNKGLVVVSGNIDAGVGYTDEDTYGPTVAADTINLTTEVTEEALGSIVIAGDILGGAGIDSLNIKGGLQELLDFSDDTSLEENIESMRGTGMNAVMGSVTGIQTLTKTGSGLALISAYDIDNTAFDSTASHEVDTITITNGSLYLNGDLDKTPIEANSSPRAQIYVGTDAGVEGDDGADDTFATEFGGTGNWNADVVMEYGGFSAGQVAINYDWTLPEPSDVILLLGPPSNVTPEIDSIGRVDITGSLLVDSSAHIRYDLSPQLTTTSTISGNGADYIKHYTADDGVVSFSNGSHIRISPNDVNRVISDGRYVIVSSDVEISGIPTGISVQFNANVADMGDHFGTLIPELAGIETANVSGTNLQRFASLSIVDNDTGEGSNGQDLVLTIQHNYAGIGLTLNQVAIGAAIDNLIYSEDLDVQDFISALDYSDLATAVATLETISPENQLAQTVAALSAGFRSHRLLENNLAVARSTSSNTIRQEVGSEGKFVPEYVSKTSRVWGTVSNDTQDYQDTSNDTEFDGYTTSFTAGVDFRINESLVLGVMAEGANAEFDYTAGSQDMQSMRFAAYGTWGQATGFYTNFALGYGSNSMSDTRDLGGVWGVNDSETDATSLSGLLTIGYMMERNAVKHGPLIGFEYQSMDVDGFAVNGGIVPVNVYDYSVDSLRGLLGYRVETTYGKFAPYATIAYAHEFEDDSIIANADIAGSPFAVTTDSIGSSVLLTLGSGYYASEYLYLNLGYRGELATENQGIDSHGLMFGANYQF